MTASPLDFQSLDARIAQLTEASHGRLRELLVVFIGLVGTVMLSIVAMIFSWDRLGEPTLIFWTMIIATNIGTAWLNRVIGRQYRHHLEIVVLDRALKTVVEEQQQIIADLHNRIDGFGPPPPNLDS